jgi:hypothetical protein
MAQRDDLGGRRPEATAAGYPSGSQGEEKPAMDQVKDQVKDLAQQAKEGTADLANQAKSQVNDLVAQGRDQTSQRLQSLASALGDVAQRLEKEDTAGFGGLARRAGEQADRAARYLKEKDLSDLVHDAEGFARRHPDLFLGGSLIAGVLVARFLKSSAERRGGDFGGERGAYRGDGGYGRGREEWKGQGNRSQGDWRERGSEPYGGGYRAPSYPTQGGL